MFLANVFWALKNNQLCSENNQVVTWGKRLFFYELNLERALLKGWVSCGMIYCQITLVHPSSIQKSLSITSAL